MSDNILAGFVVAGGFLLIGCITWFFSSRRKTFVRTFVPPEDLREVSRSIPRDESYGQGMRFIAQLQIGLGIIFALIALAVWLASWSTG